MRYSLLVLIALFFRIADSRAQSFFVDKGDTINYTGADSLKQGLWREYWENGTLKSETIYLNGKKEGLELIWNEHPNCLKEQSIYKAGVLNGTSIHYSKKCKKELEENFSFGVKNGRETTYYPNGNIQSDGVFKKGKLVGVYKIYKKNGDFAFESRSKMSDVELSSKPDPKDTTTSIVYQVFERLPAWKNKIIVTDLTGSMYPYASELLVWYQLHFVKDTTTQEFVFFNDGDNKPDSQKKLGKTGGLYYCRAKTMEELRDKMMETINNGAGGDAPENDIEAILGGIDRYKDCDNILLIADNYANIKDIKLLPKLKKPVHVLLCGADGGDVNVDYLNLAFATKGSVHTIESDIFDIAETLEGKTITVGGTTYQLVKGKFVKVTKT